MALICLARARCLVCWQHRHFHVCGSLAYKLNKYLYESITRCLLYILVTNSSLFVSVSGQAEGWAQSKRGIDPSFSWGRGRAFFLAGAKDSSPAPDVPGLRLHTAPLHCLPARVSRPQLSKGEEELYQNSPTFIHCTTVQQLWEKKHMNQ